MRLRQASLPSIAILVASASLACSSSGGAGTPGEGSPGGGSSSGGVLVQANLARERVPTIDAAAAVTANNAFAIALYSELAPTAKGGNFLTSPLSAELALTMTYAGAQGTTATQMASVLHVPSGGTSIFDAQNALTSELSGRAAAALKSATESAGGGVAPSASNYALNVVNSVWGQTGYPWDTPFLDILAQSYGTGVRTTDFETDPAAAEDSINEWVSSETAGKINPLLGPGALDTDTRMVLVNAIHVKLPWANPFQTQATQQQTFTRGDGSTVKVPMMSQSLSQDSAVAVGVEYAETAAGQFLGLPLSDGQSWVVFALPKTNLADLTKALTPNSFSNVPPTGADVNVSLPKYSYSTSTFSLSSALKALGMTQAFSPVEADFKGICDKTPDGHNLYVSDVLQKATMDVAEKGVEAAAATAVVVATAGAVSTQPPPTINIVFDKPFLVSIVDASGAILFLGQIDDPTDSGG